MNWHVRIMKDIIPQSVEAASLAYSRVTQQDDFVV